MTSRYRHRRTPTAATAFPSTLEPGEIAVNTANRQIAVGDAAAGSLGVPKILIGVRFFDVTAAYSLNDVVVQAGKIYRANGTITPGTFNGSQWTEIGAAGAAAGVVFVPAGNIASTNVQAALQELDVEKVNKAGDTMTGGLSVPDNPTDDQAANKRYVDVADSATSLAFNTALGITNDNVAGCVTKVGDTMSGPLELPAAAPTKGVQATNKSYVDAQIAPKADKTYVDAGDAALTTSVNGKVAKAGDTMSGALTFTMSGPLINLNKTDGVAARFIGQKGGLPRWQLTLGNSNAESTGNVGSDFTLLSFDDAGNLLNSLLSVNRACTSIGGTLLASPAEYLANSAPGKFLTPGTVWSAAAYLNMGAAAAFAPDCSLASDFYGTINSATGTLSNLANLKPGQKGIIYIQQDSTGSRNITSWGSAYKFPGGVKPTLTAAANAVDCISYTVLSSTFVACAFIADLK